MVTIKSFKFSPIQENTYVLYNQFNDCIIIDPGCYDDGEKEQLAAYIATNNLKPIMLLNTHCHLDHIFGNKFIAETYNLQPQIHKNEVPMLEIAPSSGLMYNLPFEMYEGDYIFVEEGDVIDFGDDAFKILLTPGHSPGSICFYDAHNGFVIAGDVLFKNSIGRTDLPHGNHTQLIQSITNKLMILPNETVVYNGHGSATTIGEERVNNPFLH